MWLRLCFTSFDREFCLGLNLWLLQVPPDLQNEVLISLLETDPDVVDYLLRRKASQSSWVCPFSSLWSHVHSWCSSLVPFLKNMNGSYICMQSDTTAMLTTLRQFWSIHLSRNYFSLINLPKSKSLSQTFLVCSQFSLESSGTSDLCSQGVKNILNHWQEAQRSKMFINESSRHNQPVVHRPHVPHNS